MSKIFKTWAYDVKDTESEEELTVYWTYMGGINFWMDFGVPHSTARTEPIEDLPWFYEKLSEMYEVEIERIPAQTNVRKI